MRARETAGTIAPVVSRVAPARTTRLSLAFVTAYRQERGLDPADLVGKAYGSVAWRRGVGSSWPAQPRPRRGAGRGAPPCRRGAVEGRHFRGDASPRRVATRRGRRRGC